MSPTNLRASLITGLRRRLETNPDDMDGTLRAQLKTALERLETQGQSYRPEDLENLNLWLTARLDGAGGDIARRDIDELLPASGQSARWRATVGWKGDDRIAPVQVDFTYADGDHEKVRSFTLGPRTEFDAVRLQERLDAFLAMPDDEIRELIGNALEAAEEPLTAAIANRLGAVGFGTFLVGGLALLVAEHDTSLSHLLAELTAGGMGGVALYAVLLFIPGMDAKLKTHFEARAALQKMLEALADEPMESMTARVVRMALPDLTEPGPNTQPSAEPSR